MFTMKNLQLLNYLLTPLRLVMSASRLYYFNKKNQTKIYSLQASLQAGYGRQVRVDRGTIIAKDVIIGDYSYVNKNSSLENCAIGKYVSISQGVFISPWEHPLNYLTTHPIGYDTTFVNRGRSRVTIGNDVLISLNVIILEGVHIADGAVIGAGAVVAHDVEPYEIVAGVPAKHIHYRFEEKERLRLLKLKWWDMEEGEIKRMMETFHSH